MLMDLLFLTRPEACWPVSQSASYNIGKYFANTNSSKIDLHLPRSPPFTFYWTYSGHLTALQKLITIILLNKIVKHHIEKLQLFMHRTDFCVTVLCNILLQSGCIILFHFQVHMWHTSPQAYKSVVTCYFAYSTLDDVIVIRRWCDRLYQLWEVDLAFGGRGRRG